MFNQKLKGIRNFFFAGKKESETHEGLQRTPTANRQATATEQHVHYIYHNGDKALQPEARPEEMQHDWWIN